MKKLNVILCLLISFSLTGCFNNNKNISDSNDKTLTTVCRGEQEIKEGISANFKYELTSKNDNVLTLISTETIESSDSEYLENVKKSIEDTYSIYNNIKYYEYEIKIEDNKLISTVNIDYSKIDLNKLVDIDKANENIIVDGKVSLNNLKNMYESLGSVCVDKNK